LPAGDRARILAGNAIECYALPDSA
jgi:hypothetical protein